MIILSGFLGLSCGGSLEDEQDPPVQEPGVEKHEEPAEITTFPGDGDILRDLGRPIVVEFSTDVEPWAFSYRLSPGSEGWSENWMPDNRRVELQHSSPLIPDRSYELEVSVEPSGRVAITFSTEGPSTLELIASDEADGVIDLDTAWTYRLQRLFQPGGLPERYRSNRSIRSGTPLLREFNRIADRLRPSTLEDLRPYLVRPDHPFRAPFARPDDAPVKFARHLLDQPRSAFVRASTGEDPPRPSPDEEWGHVVCDDRTKFWAPMAYISTAEEGCRILRNTTWNMYGEFKKVMVRDPGKDTSVCDNLTNPELVQACLNLSGGDDRIDFYLVPALRLDEDGGWCRSVNPHDRHSPQWIEINRGLTGTDLARTIAHELFHTFQSAWDDWEDGWWAEATATWAEEYIEPGWNTEEDLDLVFDMGAHLQKQLTLEDGDHEYAVYLFPYYLEKIRIGSERIIGDIWRVCETEDSLDAIDSVLDNGFDEALREFSVVNLDWGPYLDRYRQRLGLFGHHDAMRWILDVRDEDEIRIVDVLPPLSARYHFVYDGLDPMATPLVRFRLDDYAVNEKFMLHAIINYDNGVVEEEDWSELSERKFCINRKEENFDQIFLIPVSAFRPAKDEVGSSGGGPGGTESVANIVISVETEACRPTIGTGEFTIQRETQNKDSVTSYSFVETVSGKIEFNDFDRGNAEYKGEARVRYDEHIENIEREARGGVVEWVKTTIIDRKGAGDVECSLHYAWGDEDTSYDLDCGEIEIRETTYERIEYPIQGEVKERNSEWTGMTDIDDVHISSHYGELPQRYDLEIKGHHLEKDTTPGRTTRDYSRWSFNLEPPESSE